MQINNASSYTPQSSGTLSVDNKNQVAEQRDRFRVQQAQQGTQKSAEQTQQQNQQARQVERFDVDEQALALVEQAQAELDSQQALNSQRSESSQDTLPLSVQSNNLTGSASNSTNKQDNRQASYDTPSQQNQTAVATYSSVGQMAQRENIQQVFGIDLFV
jgi:hypothetical protein